MGGGGVTAARPARERPPGGPPIPDPAKGHPSSPHSPLRPTRTPTRPLPKRTKLLSLTGTEPRSQRATRAARKWRPGPDGNCRRCRSARGSGAAERAERAGAGRGDAGQWATLPLRVGPRGDLAGVRKPELLPRPFGAPGCMAALQPPLPLPGQADWGPLSCAGPGSMLYTRLLAILHCRPFPSAKQQCVPKEQGPWFCSRINSSYCRCNC
jgi:hypothetical protein